MKTDSMPSTLGDHLDHHPEEMMDVTNAISILRSELDEIVGRLADFDEEAFLAFLKEDDGGHDSLLDNVQRSALEVALTIAHVLNRHAQEDFKAMITAITDNDLADPTRRAGGLKRIMSHNRALELLAKPRRIAIQRTAADVTSAAQVAA